MLYDKSQIDNFNEQTFAYLEVEAKDHVLTITLNRPEKKNAFNGTFLCELAYSLAYAHHSNSIWAVVLAANGDIFCAGADLNYFAGIPEEQTDSTIPKPEGAVIVGDEFSGLHKPCIARVHAPVFAGGFLMIFGCTHVVASDNATFALPEVKRGIWPMQIMASLKPIVPPRKLLDLCMRGKKLSADEALDLGIVTQVCEPEKLNEEIDALLEDILSNSPSAIRLGLKAFQEMSSVADDEKPKYLYKMLQEVLETKDAAEGLAAFREKRDPVWTGE